MYKFRISSFIIPVYEISNTCILANFFKEFFLLSIKLEIPIKLRS